MTKLLLAALTLGLIAAGATVVLAAPGDGSPSPARLDLSGPCDEPEHAADPECQGPPTSAAPVVDDDADELDDSSGPGGGGHG